MTYTVYSQPDCPPCKRAKDLLDSKGLEYKELNVREDKVALQKLVDEMVAFGLRPTTPQIFTNTGKRIGGYDDLVEYFKNAN